METQLKETPIRKFPTLSGFLIVVLLLFIVQGTFGVVFGHVLAEQQSMAFFLAYTLSFLIAVVVLLLGQKHVQGDPVTGLFRKFNVQIVPYLLIFILGFGYIADFLVGLLPMPQWIKEMFESMSKVDVWTFLSVCIAAPLFEEVLCRGVLLRSFISNYGVRKALFWSAFLFAFIHLNPWQAIPAFGLGYFMAWLFYKTGSLLPAIFVHFTNNLISFYAMAAFGSDYDMAKSVGWGVNIGLIAIGVVLCLFSIVKIKKILAVESKE